MTSLWSSPPPIPRNLSNLSKGELAEHRERLSIALRRREFLISPQGYDTVVTQQQNRIEEIKREIEDFLNARKNFAEEIEKIKITLKRIDELNALRLREKEAKTTTTSIKSKKSLSIEELIERAKKKGLNSEAIENMKSMGLDLRSVLSTMI